ncbi:Cytochrome b561 and DOMON domain-containing protein [Nymphaea thermarum]|nr:Cytochrome b561 and DOMON domain-containing protein [Nymphaea thermarum]
MRSLLFILPFLLCFLSVNSQKDGCSSNLSLSSSLSFNTTSLSCQSVWSSEDFILRYQETKPGLWSFVLSAPDSNSWVAIGFSSSGRMPGTSAVVGWPTGSGAGMIKQYSLSGYSQSAVQPDQGDLDLVSPVFVSESSRVYLAFQLKAATPLSSLVYAVGPKGDIPDVFGMLDQHRSYVSTTLDFSKAKRPSASPKASGGSDDNGFDSGSRSGDFGGGSSDGSGDGLRDFDGRSRTSLASGGSSSFTVKRTHGALNVLAWVILLPLGIIAARHYKHHDPSWFYSHLALQMTAFGLAIAGFLTGLSLQGQFHVADGHKVLGILALGLACVQATALLIRPGKTSKFRRYWNWYHHWVGRIALLIGLINVFYGVKAAREPKSWYEYLGIVLAILGSGSAVLEVKNIYSKYFQ